MVEDIVANGVVQYDSLEFIVDTAVVDTAALCPCPNDNVSLVDGVNMVSKLAALAEVTILDDERCCPWSYWSSFEAAADAKHRVYLGE